MSRPWSPPPVLLDEHERLRRLERYGVRQGQHHDVLDHVTALAATLLETPIALVSLVADRQQFFLSRFGLDAESTDRDVSFCGHAIARPIPLVVGDAHQDPRFATNPLVAGPLNVTAYLGVPLFAGPGHSGIGTLCVIDSRPRAFTQQHERSLHRLSTIVEHYLDDLVTRRAWEDSPLSMVTVERGGRCLRANPAFARMLGREEESLLERPLTSFLFPADRSVFTAMLSHAITHAESPTRRELRFVRLDGEVVLGGTSISPLLEPSDHAVCVIRDISLERRTTARSGVVADVRRELTEPLERARSHVEALERSEHRDARAPLLRDLDELEAILEARIGDIAARVRAEAELASSEQRLRSVMQHAIGLLVVIDDRGRIVDTNETALTSLGWTLEDLVGTPMHQVDPSFTDAECRRAFEEAAMQVSANREFTLEPVTFVRRDGSLLHVERSSMIMDWNGPGRLVILARDVSAAHARENSLARQRDALEVRVRSGSELIETLHRMEQALKTSLEEKEMLLKEIHHRVKNNLQMVSSLLTMQLEQIVDPAARIMITEGVQRVRSMALVHQHLYGSISLERVELGAYARSLADQLRHAIAPNSVLLVESSPVEIDVQRAASVGLVLNELITNALKYGGHHPTVSRAHEEGEPDVMVRVEERNRRVYIVVRDHGPGLPADFEMARNTTLGLQIVLSLTRQLRGRASAHSEHGAVFVIEFPL